MPTRNAFRRPLALLSAATILLGIVAIGAGASAAPPKPFRADFDSSPDPIPAGATATISVTIFNDATPQQLGSSNISAPAGYVIPAQTISLPSPATATVVGSSQIQLRNLAIPALGSFTFAFTAVAPCTGNAAWSLDAKQSNNYQGPPGNSFVLNAGGSDLVTDVVGTCRLAFSTPPANAELGSSAATRSEAITDTPYDPAGDPVAVEILSAAGQRVATSTATVTLALAGGTASAVLELGGSTDVSSAAVAGVASFAGLTVDRVGFGYTLAASSPGIDSGSSTPFNVVQFGQVCAGGTCDSPTAANPSGNVTGDVHATNVPPNTELAVAFAGDDPCAGTGYVPFTPDTFTVLALENGEPSAGVVLQITMVVSNASGRQLQAFEVCYATDIEGKTFVDESGQQVSQGILANCTGAITSNCVVSRSKDRTGTVTLVFTVLDGRGKI